MRRRNELINRERKELETINQDIMKNIFANNYTVRYGPFSGMKYINSSNGSQLLPKILGSYEEPIHDWIYRTLSNTNYTKIIDIGCAEGYYAVGFAIKRPDLKVFAYDIDKTARENCQKMIELNNVNNVTINKECTANELDAILDRNCLVFCDIEGYENELLDPAKVKNLEKSDIILECHDFIVDGMTDRMIERFKYTHKISIVIDYGQRSRCKYPVQASENEYSLITDERRPAYMKFMHLEVI